MACFTATCVFLASMKILQPANVNHEHAFCLAMNIYHEARAESLAGQVQVAHTTISRAEDSRFPDDICGVVKEQYTNPKIGKKTCAFSWTCDKSTKDIDFRKNGKVDEIEVDSFKIATVISVNILSGYLPDMCDGANYYYNPDLANPNWGKIYSKKCIIDNHVFLKREEGSLK